MTLENIKEEYKKSIDLDSKRDVEQLEEEIDMCDDLDEFIEVVAKWSNHKKDESTEKLILRRLIETA